MFTVYMSNSLEKLKDELYVFLRDNLPASPLAQEIIMVQSQGMQKWLSLRLSEKFGSWASFKYLFPNKLLDEIFHSVPGTQPASSYDPFNRDNLSWLLMDELARITEESPPEFSDICQYLTHDHDGLKRWQLATRIAYTLDQYLTFRPDYITAWEEGKTQPDSAYLSNNSDFSKNCQWQCALWQSIQTKLHAKHRIDHFKDILSAIQKNQVNRDALPARVIVFGIPILPPLHVEVLSAISSLCPVHMFLLHPTTLHDDMRASRNKTRTPTSNDRIECPNALLESFGNIGRGFLQELHRTHEIIFKSLFVEDIRENRSLLCSLQCDILHNKNTDYNHIARGDSSISIVSCHSAMREAEVLLDYLLDILNTTDAPRLNEIIVMTPDIERYAPYIDAVFSSSQPAIPYTISDRSPKSEHAAVASFFSLLDVAASRFEASVVLDLLEKKPLQKRLKITDDDLALIKKWIGETRIRWGFDAADKKSLEILEAAENTWKAGIDRMFLGFAMPEEAFLDGIVPYNQIEGSSADLLGKFSRFIHDLHDFIHILSKPHTLSEWQAILSEWTARFLDLSDEGNPHYQLIDEALAKLSSISTSSDYVRSVHFCVIRAYLETLLAEHVSVHNFLSGKLTFCAMLPMRSIPFKVICLIGMNDGIFPRQDSNIAFDLMAKSPRPGDRSLRDEDRYLFLEALISAKEKLYISYTGQSIVDSSEIPPSVVVGELIDYLQERLSPSIFNTIVIKHPLQPFSKRYFTGGSLFSYSEENLHIAKKLVQPNRTPLPTFIDGKISDPVFKDLSLAELCSFFENPAKYFLQRGLGLRFRKEAQETEDDEPFSIDRRSDFQIKSMLLDDLLNKDVPNELKQNAFQIFRSMGLLPHGTVGMVAFEQLYNATQAFAQKASEFLSDTSFPPVYVELKLSAATATLSGMLHTVYENYQTIFHPASMRAKHIIKGWIYHLALCTLEDVHLPKKTAIVCTGSAHQNIHDIIIFRPLNHSAAHKLLSDLAHLAITHEVELFHFIPECALDYFLEYRNTNKITAAVQAALRKWSSNYGEVYMEKDDPYQDLCFRNMDEKELFGEQFHENAINIFTPIFDAMEAPEP